MKSLFAKPDYKEWRREIRQSFFECFRFMFLYTNTNQCATTTTTRPLNFRMQISVWTHSFVNDIYRRSLEQHGDDQSLRLNNQPTCRLSSLPHVDSIPWAREWRTSPASRHRARTANNPKWDNRVFLSNHPTIIIVLAQNFKLFRILGWEIGLTSV